APAGSGLMLEIPQPRAWSPDDPFLYDLKVELRRGADAVDAVTSYFGLRDLTVAADGGGVGGGVRLLLAIAPRHARWRVCGGVAVGAPVAATVDAGLAFDPVVHALPGLDPDGLLHSIRAGAYAGSRRGRGVGLTPDGSRATDRS
ncbi:MAG TPA: hypothetical protein VFT95_04390, partial [Micromonosporaceae bacterium]|nr:hypothetical protein [Micromonosporaceae bacterium]